MTPHLALALLLPAAWLTWRWSRLVSGALWATLVVTLLWLKTGWEPLRWVSAMTGLVGAFAMWDLRYLDKPELRRFWGKTHVENILWRTRVLAALLVASMAVDGAALLIHKGHGQWGPQPAFQCLVLLAMCVIAWPRRKS